MAEPLLKVSNVETYYGPIMAIRGVSFDVPKGGIVTILLVEQNANMALQTADYGYVLEVGRIVMADTCARLLQKEDIKEFYLGIKEQGARGKRRWKKRKTWR